MSAKRIILTAFLLVLVVAGAAYFYYRKNIASVSVYQKEKKLQIIGSVAMSDGTCINFLKGHTFGFFSDFSGDLKKTPCFSEKVVARCMVDEKNFQILFYQGNRYKNRAQDYCNSLKGSFTLN